MSGWPACRGLRPWRGEVKVEQGVWGKVHRQASDFRWIAASPGLAAAAEASAELESSFGVGSEDEPTRCLFWRRLADGRILAIAASPSRAVDAAGRSGFLERRLFTWRPESGDSIVQGMVALLPAAVEIGAGSGLARAPGSWQRADFHLPLESFTVHISEEEVRRRLEHGRRRLTEGVGEDALTVFYARLLAGQSPVVLPSARPFSAPILAALLLPIPAEKAQSMSLAGWIPSSRVSLASLADRWDVVVAQVGAPPTELPPEHLDTGRRWARALLDGDPSRLNSENSAPGPGPTSVEPFLFEPFEQVFDPLPSLDPAPSTEGAPWLEPVRAFVKNPETRWLDPSSLASGLLQDASAAPQLDAWRSELRRCPPRGADAWQWSVKIDLLAALLIAAAPASPEAKEITFTSGRVPSLLFVGHLDIDRFGEWRRDCPPDRFEPWREQSCSVQTSPEVRRRMLTFEGVG